MDRIWFEYVGSRTPDGIGQDFEHQKYYWGPQNDWKCEVPVLLGGQLIQEMGIDKFLPCLAPGAAEGADISDLKAAQKELAKDQERLAEGEEALKGGNLALQKREDDAQVRGNAQDERDEVLATREKKVTSREKEVTKRENAAKKGKKR